ncbi:uncharacterized protein LOC120524637 [Polypterus senegalus]|uniref:uncharacterized protein LOC120524637 n=1 Tax=Polypterus senegalus TaxID=55291 RepID=UPI00196411AA|nr:uncharacterized protein LOC120524637 [Polypterus senegalus]
MMLLKGQAVLPLFLLLWLSGINFLNVDGDLLEIWKDDPNPTVGSLSSENDLDLEKNDSFISPVLPYDEVVTSQEFKGDDEGSSGDPLYMNFEVLDVEEVDAPVKQDDLNIGVVNHNLKAINDNQKGVAAVPVLNVLVSDGADFELQESKEGQDSEHSGAWSLGLGAYEEEEEAYQYKTLMYSGNVCSKVVQSPYESTCAEGSMSAQFFGSSADLKVRVNSSLVLVTRLAHQCKYKVEKRSGSFIFTTYNDGCNVQKMHGCYVLTLTWQNAKVSLACPVSVTGGLPPAVRCSDTSMTVGLPSGSLDDLKVKDHLHWVAVHSIAKRCQYELLKDAFERIFFTVSYKGCHVKEQGSYHVLTLQYTAPDHKEEVLDMRCPIYHGEQVPVPHFTVPPVSEPKVSCHVSTMDVLLPGATPDQVKVKDYNQEVGVQQLAQRCHYHLLRRGYDLVFSASYKSCHVRMEGNHYILTVVYKARSGQPVVVHMKCPSSHWATTTAPVATSPRKPSPLCKASSMSVLLPPGSLDQVKVLEFQKNG